MILCTVFGGRGVRFVVVNCAGHADSEETRTSDSILWTHEVRFFN